MMVIIICHHFVWYSDGCKNGPVMVLTYFTYLFIFRVIMFSDTQKKNCNICYKCSYFTILKYISHLNFQMPVRYIWFWFIFVSKRKLVIYRLQYVFFCVRKSGYHHNFLLWLKQNNFIISIYLRKQTRPPYSRGGGSNPTHHRIL